MTLYIGLGSVFFFSIPCPHCPTRVKSNRILSLKSCLVDLKTNRMEIVPMILNIGFGSFHPSSVHRKKIMEVQICIIWEQKSH